MDAEGEPEVDEEHSDADGETDEEIIVTAAEVQRERQRQVQLESNARVEEPREEPLPNQHSANPSNKNQSHYRDLEKVLREQQAQAASE